MFQSLALTGLGGLLAIAGTMLGHHWQAREARRSRSETYDREDRYRLHQDRRTAYRDFHLAFGHMRSEIRDESQEHVDRPARLRQARAEAWAALVPLWHIASSEVLTSAAHFMREINAIAQEEKAFEQTRWGDLVREYTQAVRRDLLAGTSGGRQEQLPPSTV